tara:strand:- start:16831 stop:17460 length:630 start_codon:yes stop_codon:yes gene_type:complete
MKVSVTEKAYVKLVLHALKHPTRDVFGCLVGREGSNGDLQVTDALPMVHSTLAVTPTVEIALEQFSIHAELTGGLFLIGVYVANERLGDVGVGQNVQRVADTVKANAPNRNACVFVVDAEKLKEALDGNGGGPNGVLQMYRKEGEGVMWERTGGQSGSIAVDGNASETLKKTASNSENVKKLVDFDDHLDDPGLDWRNHGLDAVVEKGV